MSEGWPARLEDGSLLLRPLGHRDRSAWIDVRNANEEWLRPWEATPPGGDPTPWSVRHSRASYAELLRRQRLQARRGTHYPFGMFLDGAFVGQVSLGEVVRGAFFSAYIGYWIDQGSAGRGLTPAAVALVADHAFRAIGLHRIEANIRPENTASLAVVRKVGFEEEGLHRRYLAIDGDWRDHRSFVLFSDGYPGGVHRTLKSRRT
jgi:ribosomal-protein-alanine N-acetyltransferase